MRIIKLGANNDGDLISIINNTIGKRISQPVGEGLVQRLAEEDFLTAREAAMIQSIIANTTLKQ
jgi:transcriptional regulator CtsR